MTVDTGVFLGDRGKGRDMVVDRDRGMALDRDRGMGGDRDRGMGLDRGWQGTIWRRRILPGCIKCNWQHFPTPCCTVT